jgi:hypothetical protein
MCVYHHGLRECENNYLMASNKAAYADKEPRGGAPDGPVRRRLATRDERAGLKGEYGILLDEVSHLKVHQTSATYMLASQQGVSGGDAYHAYVVP